MALGSLAQRTIGAQIVEQDQKRSSHLYDVTTQDAQNFLRTESKNCVSLDEVTTRVELRYWFVNYLLLRGKRTMGSLGEMSPYIRLIADEVDMIGWRTFFMADYHEAYIPTRTHTVGLKQLCYGTDWMKRLASKLSKHPHTVNGYTGTSLFTTS
jgi:hypothetical protein